MLASLTHRIARLGSLIKFSHSVFALPFALAMFVLVARTHTVHAGQLCWIIVAIISARTAAMGWNRLVDRDIDALNPRTRNRELPRGAVSLRSVHVLVAVSSVIFMVSSAMLARHCLILAPFVLALLFFYSWTKRFTAWSHFVLGLALAMAPGGVWYALTATVRYEPLVLMSAVLLWVVGFDMLYSCQDVAFDRSQALFSFPAKIGVERTMRVARLLHFCVVLILAWFGMLMGCGQYYYYGLGMFGLMLLSQHRLVSPANLTRIDAAFFTRNGLSSLIYLAAVISDWGYS